MVPPLFAHENSAHSLERNVPIRVGFSTSSEDRVQQGSGMQSLSAGGLCSLVSITKFTGLRQRTFEVLFIMESVSLFCQGA